MSINIQTENNQLKKIAGTYGTDDRNNITIDSELSSESENPVQNKTITKKFNDTKDNIGTMKLSKEYITEHDTLSSFINGLEDNTSYIFIGTNSTISEMGILMNLGLSPKQANGIVKISCGFNKYNIFVEFESGSILQQRIIGYDPNVPDNYSLGDWYTFITEDGSVKHADTADNADMVDGYHVNDSPSADPRGKIPIVKSDGVMEVGKYIDFHVSTKDWDNDARITADYDKIEIDKPIESPSIKTSSLTVSRSFSGYGEPQFVVANPTYPNAKVIGYVDQEGANFRLQCNEANNYYEFDTLGNSLRLYHYYDGATPTLISSVGSGANLELQIARATKDSDGNVIKDTYMKKDCVSISYGGGMTTLAVNNYGSVAIAAYYGSNYSGMLINGSTIDPYDVKHPSSVPKISFGQSGRPWNGFYSYVSMTTVSDRRQKKNIYEVDSNTASQLISKIIPVTYQLKDGESGRTHYGMISQQVEEVLNELEIDSKDFAAFIKSPITEDVMEQATNDEGELLFDEENNPVMIKVGENETEDFTYMLRYEEFIPILWKNAQDKNRKIEQLQKSNEELNNKVVNLEERIAKLESYINIKDTIDAEGRFQ